MTSQGTKKPEQAGGHSRPVERGGTSQHTKKTERARGTHILSSAEGGTSQHTKDERGCGESIETDSGCKKQTSKDGLTQSCVVISFNKRQFKKSALQLTQIDGKATRHVFITASVLTLPFSNASWVL
jgi:hypothetical protein